MRYSPELKKYLEFTYPDPEKLNLILKSIEIAPKFFTLRRNPLRGTLDELKTKFKGIFGFNPKILRPNEIFFDENGDLIENNQDNQLKKIGDKILPAIFIIIPIKQNSFIPLKDKVVYCDKFAAEAVMMGADLFVPGVREIPQKLKKGDEVSILLSKNAFPNIKNIIPMEIKKNKLAEIEREIEKKTEKKTTKNTDLGRNNLNLNETLLQPLANGIVEINSKDYPFTLKGIFVKNHLPRYSVIPYRRSELFTNGWISDHSFPALLGIYSLVDKIIQNIHSLQRKSKSLIIYDTCSAPGHKTIALVELLESSGFKNYKIYSIDRSKNRLMHLKDDLQRLNLPKDKIEILPIKLEKIKKRMPELVGNADVLIFDPPCSALGSRPRLFIDKSIKALEDYVSNQHRLIKIVHPLLRKGGWLFYNTCTLPVQENEEQIAYFKKKWGYSFLDLPKYIKNFSEKSIIVNGLDITDDKGIARFSQLTRFGLGYFFSLLQKPIQ